MGTYVLNRNYVLRSMFGHSVGFKKGEPVFVPAIIEREAVAIGAERVEGEAPDLGLDADNPRPPMLDQAEREKQIKAAFEMLVEKNDASEFTASGMPKVAVVEKLVGFDVDRTEVAALWSAFKAAE